jgi:hypothetical protein
MKTENETSYPSYFGDIPLKIAMLGWTPFRYPCSGIPGRIIVIPHPMEGSDWFRYFKVTDSTGACRGDWRESTAKERLLMLYIEAWHIIARDGISPHDMHAALMVIPEYRESLSGETFFSWGNTNP